MSAGIVAKDNNFGLSWSTTGYLKISNFENSDFNKHCFYYDPVHLTKGNDCTILLKEIYADLSDTSTVIAELPSVLNVSPIIIKLTKCIKKQFEKFIPRNVTR